MQMLTLIIANFQISKSKIINNCYFKVKIPTKCSSHLIIVNLNKLLETNQTPCKRPLNLMRYYESFTILNKRPENTMNFFQCNFISISYVTLFMNQQKNFQANFEQVLFSQLVDFSISINERFFRLTITNTKFDNIQNSLYFLSATGNQGNSPQMKLSNVTVNNYRAPTFFYFNTIRPFIYFTNFTFSNISTTSQILNLCCQPTTFFTNLLLQTSQFSAFLNLFTGWATFTNTTFIENDGLIDQSTFLIVDKKADFKILSDSKFYFKGHTSLVTGNTPFATLSDFTIIGSNLSSIISIKDASVFWMKNVTIIETNQQNDPQKGYLIYLTSSQITTIDNITIRGVRQAIFFFENQQTMTLQNQIFDSINCGKVTCFLFQNSQIPFTLTTSIFSNIVSEIVLFQLDFCANITISKSMFTQIDINAGQLMSTFQTDVHIDQTSFIGIIYDVAGNSSAFQFFDSQIFDFSNIIIDDSLSDKTKSVVSLVTKLINHIEIQNVTFMSISSNSAPMLSLSEFSSIQASQLSFQDCHSFYSLLEVKTSLKNFQIDLTLIECFQTDGTCINLETDSDFNITGLSMEQSTGSALYIVSLNGAKIYLQNVELTQNSEANFYFEKCDVSISNFKLFGVEAVDNLFDLTSSSMKITNATVVELDCTATFSLLDSDINIMRSSFINENRHGIEFMKSKYSDIQLFQVLLSGYGNQLFDLQEKQLKIDSSYFIKNVFASYFKTSEVSITISNTNFKADSVKSFFDCTVGSSLLITNTNIQFQSNSNLGIIQNINSITFDHVQFQSDGTGFSIQESSEIQITGSTFSGTSNLNGGCLYIQNYLNQLLLSISQSSITNCSADNFGGGIYLDGLINGSISSSKFTLNNAIVGGGLTYNGTQIIEVIDTKFESNYAKLYAGGAVANINPIFFTRSNFITNLGISQSKNGSFGVKIKVPDQEFDYIMRNQFAAREVIEAQEIKVIEIASGQSRKLIIAILDSDDQLVVNDNESVGQILSSSGQDLAIVQGGKAQSQNGLLIFDSLKIIKEPGNNFTLGIEIQFVQSSSSTFPLSFISRNCSEGEIYKEDKTCQPCAIDTFSLANPHDERLKTQACQYCSKNANCIGEAIYPKVGYWIYNQQSLLIMECKKSEFCLGKENLFEKRSVSKGYELESYIQQTSEMYDQQCIEGHHSVMCNECVPGYFKFTSTSKCMPCQGNKAVTYLIIILIVGILMYSSISQSENYMSKNQEGQEKAVLIKIFLNYIQTLTLLGSVSLQWTPNIASIFDFTQDFFGTSFNFISIQCLQFEYTQDQEKQFYLNLVMQMMIPFGIFIFNTIYFLVMIFLTWRESVNKASTIKDLEQKEKAMIKHKSSKEEFKILSLYIIVLNAVVCLHLFYPLLTSTPTQLFYCSTIATDTFGNKVSYLSKNLTVQCWTKTFNEWFFGFGIFLSLFFGLGIPGVLCFYMYLYKNDLNNLDLQSKSALNRSITKARSEPIGKQSISIHQKKIVNLVQVGVSDKTEEKKSIQQTKQPQVQSEYTAQRKKSIFNRHSTYKKALTSQHSKLKKSMKRLSTANALKQSIKKKTLKQSEVFLFLVDPFKSSVFYWEIVRQIKKQYYQMVLLRKFFLIIVGLLTGIATNDDQNKSVKYLLLNIYMIIFFQLNLKYDPFFSPLFNMLENYSFIAIILTCLAGIISTAFSTVTSEVISNIIFFITNGCYLSLMAFTFIALVYLKDHQEELNQKDLNFWKKSFRSILKHHRRRVLTQQPSMNQSRILQEEEGASAIQK